MKITIIGTGYVGLVNGVCMSYQGADVTCIDIDKEKIDRLSRGESPIYEELLEPMTTVDVTGKYWIGYYHEKAYLADAYKGIYGIEEYIIEHHSPERIDVPEGMDNSIDELRK